MRTVMIETRRTKKWSLSEISLGNKDWNFGSVWKKVEGWKISLPPQDCVNDFEFYKAWKARIEKSLSRYCINTPF